MINLCTLFDSYYLDKAMALYRSLERVTQEYRLYAFCMDDTSWEILQAMQLVHVEIIHHSRFEDAALLLLKEERSTAEYCWTCTPVIIEYVLDHYDVENCTYVDADLYFFHDPQILFYEIAAVGANVVVTPHRFTNSLRDQRIQRRSGKYCVEFNYFDQSQNSREALTWWRERCAEWCYYRYEPERMGDQKYLDRFPVLFQGVHELRHLGGGVAPWNLAQYHYVRNTEGGDIILRERRSGREFPLVFYHYQNLRYLTKDWVNIASGTHDRVTKDVIYALYLREIEQCRALLADYGITFPVWKSYASNRFVAFVQAHITRYRIRSLSDLYDLRRSRRREDGS